MTQITSMTGPASSLRAQLRAQAEAALALTPNKHHSPTGWEMPSAKWQSRKIQLRT